MFDKAFILEISRMALYKYGDKNLSDQLKNVFGEHTTLPQNSKFNFDSIAGGSLWR